MPLKLVVSIELPPHAGPGGFDHAAIHRARGCLYVAHTANDAVDVIDTRAGRYVRSMAGLKGVAGALVDEGRDLVLTSNRGEDTVGIFSTRAEDAGVKVAVGARPNGLAYDPHQGLLLCANVGEPGVTNSASVTWVDVPNRRAIATTTMPGRTRWAVFDPDERIFSVNIADPPRLVVLDARTPDRVVRHVDLPARGPHGLDLDRARRRLLCACDEGKLVSVDSHSGEILGALDLSGPPDVVFLNASLRRLYVAIGDPGVIDVIDIEAWTSVGAVGTGPGAHTIAFEEGSNRVYAFLAHSHSALVFEDLG